MTDRRFFSRAVPVALGCLTLMTACGGPPEEASREPSFLESYGEIVSDSGVTGNALPPYTLALTYDDGPDTYTLDVANYLAQQGIKATFFINGCRIIGSPAPIRPADNSGNCTEPPRFPESTVAQLVALGHRVANHTEDHPNLPNLVPDTQTILSQVRLTQNVLDRYITDGFFLMRPPYGAWDVNVANALRTDPALNRLAGPVVWDIDGGDWSCFKDGLPVEECGQRYLNALNARQYRNGVFLMHDRLEFNVGSTYTLQLTKWLVERLPRPQYTFVPLDAIPNLTGTRTSLPARAWTANFSDGEGWAASASRYGTLRIGDINGDGRKDVCGRRAEGVFCVLSTGAAFTSGRYWVTSDFTDAAGWGPEKHSTTVQLGDVNGDGRADLCGRGAGGLICSLSTGSAFAAPTLWSSNGDFSDADGWGTDVGHYGTLRLGDVNGDGRADVCGRGIDGIYCALSTGTSFLPKTGWKVGDFSNAGGWLPPEYSTTIQLGDINGDGRADVCGRGSGGVACALANGTGNGFGPVVWTSFIFSNFDSWANSPSKYRSIRMGDVNGDGKADICGRNATGIACAFGTAAGTFTGYRYLNNAEYRDDQGWNTDWYGSTLLLGDFNGGGQADVCGRGTAGLFCALSP
jgi:peptidoglycan/xylan/chitin deacetylase (PgdA/CDA1 family)